MVLPPAAPDAALQKMPADLTTIQAGRSSAEALLLARAWSFLSEVVADTARCERALAISRILAELKLDTQTIAAALLAEAGVDAAAHDLAHLFGSPVAHLCAGVAKMAVIHDLNDFSREHRRDEAQAEALRKMLLAMAEDVRVVLIKLAERLYVMRSLTNAPAVVREREARANLELFAPLANRLGVWQIKWELEDLAFRVLEPEAYQHIARKLAERRADRERYVAHFIDECRAALAREGIDAEVKGRVKHIYGIHKKMRRKGSDFEQVYDMRAVRILVREIKDCYAALGAVHTLWRPIPGEFDDYIATPKENNYRSLHTAVIGPEGKAVEVQIRTHDMHQESEYGVAAHWRYKEGRAPADSFDRKIAWLRQLLDWKDELAEAGEFVEQFKSTVFSDRVYVFTPKGSVIDLPQDATPLDFAYHIHTEIGHRCRGAKVNGHIVPLTHALKTGEQVEIVTVKEGGPSRDWLNPHLGYLHTSKARAKVQQWFKAQNQEHNLAAGRALLEKELQRLGLAEINFEKLAQRLGMPDTAHLFLALAHDEIKPTRLLQAAQHLLGAQAPTTPVLATPNATAPRDTGLQIQGVGNLLTQVAGCCKPVPGDAIVGYITRGHGITIHRRDCANAQRLAAEGEDRMVEVHWGAAAAAFPVDVLLTAYDRPGLLRDVTALLANEKIQVLAFNTHLDAAHGLTRMQLRLELRDVEELSRVLARLDRIPNVVEVRRERHA